VQIFTVYKLTAPAAAVLAKEKKEFTLDEQSDECIVFWKASGEHGHGLCVVSAA
jgi:hypothetical protein